MADSDILSVRALGTTIVVIDTVSIAVELMDKRSSRYSSRPETVMAKELLGWEYLMGTLPYGEKWKDRRRMFVQHFRPTDTSIIHPQEHEFVARLLVELNRTPEEFFEVLRGSIGGFIISLAYGIPIKARGDPYLELSEKSSQVFTDAVTPGSYFVDLFPILKHIPAWFPGAGFQRKARELRPISAKLKSSPFKEAVTNFGTPLARPSFVSIALGAMDENAVDAENQKEVIQDTAAMFYMAGTDTIVSSLLSWIWVMLKNPLIQHRVRIELDRVLDGRLPDFGDQDQLPYLMATLMESMRLAPPAPIGGPHLNTEDDVFGDYFIPRASIIVPNIWSMLRREDEYGPDASSFNPDRFLSPDGRINPKVLDPHLVAFGFGRRSCPGAHIGRSMVWLAAASLATIFEWREPLGEDGTPIDQPEDYETGLV
ncbi:hypothetical protein MD484_g6664, partial [Candolleomyces efflorescens]